MQLTNVLVLAGALGAVAHPSGHSHLHRSVHEKREPAFYKAVHSKLAPPTAVTTTVPIAKAPAAATVASATPAAVTTAASTSSAAFVPFCGGAKSKRATLADIASTGNVGVAGNWGCNIMAVDHSIASKYDYTSVYTNVADVPYQVACGNKIGPTGLIDGFWHSALTFTLAPGEAKTVAIDANSQGFCAFAPNSVPKTSFGEWAGTWVEFDLGSDRNSGWSGADCSSLVSASQNLDVPGCQVCYSGTCSTIYPGGEGDNAFIAGTADKDGLGLNIPAGPVQLQVKVGYSKA